MVARTAGAEGPLAGQGRRCPSLMRLAMDRVVANVEVCVAAGREVWARLPSSLVLKIYEEVTARDR